MIPGSLAVEVVSETGAVFRSFLYSDSRETKTIVAARTGGEAGNS